MCRDHPEWTSNNRDTQDRSHGPAAARTQKGIPAQRHFRDARAHVETGRRAYREANTKDVINDDPVNRTRVRAKMRVVEIPQHSQEEMKKAS
jgi:LAS superfamily LD-carboxypeptidase LdcB